MTEFPDAGLVVRHLLALHGGKAKALARIEADHEEFLGRWNQHTDQMGRILRAHLVVEHYLSEYVARRNPNLGSLDAARVSFAQEVVLAGQGNPEVDYLLPGIRRVNVIRNRLAHNLGATVTDADREFFLGIDLFRAIREADTPRSDGGSSPVDVMEDFAKHAAVVLSGAGGEKAKLWAEAFRRARAEEDEGSRRGV